MRSLKSSLILASMSAISYATSKIDEIKRQDDLETVVNEKIKSVDKALLVTLKGNSLAVNRIMLPEQELPEFLLHTVDATLNSLPESVQISILKRLSDKYTEKAIKPEVITVEDHH